MTATVPSPGYVNVALQLRPLLMREKTEKIAASISDGIVMVVNGSGKNEYYKFDHILQLTDSASAVEAERLQLVSSAVSDAQEGLCHAFVAYGSVGSGQDICLFGSEAISSQKRGLISTVYRELHRILSTRARFRVELTHLGADGETVIDLLHPTPKTAVKVKESFRGTVAEGITKVVVKSPEHLDELLTKSRKLVASRFNNLFTLAITTVSKDAKELKSQIAFLDISRSAEDVRVPRSSSPIRSASPERVKASGGKGSSLKPSPSFVGDLDPSIERVLRGVAQSVDAKKTVLPLHEDPLLWLAKNFLQTSSHISLIATIGPGSGSGLETLAIVRFAISLAGREMASTPVGAVVSAAPKLPKMKLAPEPIQLPSNGKGSVEEKERQCILCNTRPVRFALIPCGHYCFCAECVESSIRGKCTLCGVAVTGKLRIHHNYPSDSLSPTSARDRSPRKKHPSELLVHSLNGSHQMTLNLDSGGLVGAEMDAAVVLKNFATSIGSKSDHLGSQSRDQTPRRSVDAGDITASQSPRRTVQPPLSPRTDKPTVTPLAQKSDSVSSPRLAVPRPAGQTSKPSASVPSALEKKPAPVAEKAVSGDMSSAKSSPAPERAPMVKQVARPEQKAVTKTEAKSPAKSATPQKLERGPSEIKSLEKQPSKPSLRGSQKKL